MTEDEVDAKTEATKGEAEADNNDSEHKIKNYAEL